MPETLLELLEHAASVRDKGLRFVDRRERDRFFSWAAIRRQASATAGSLVALGIAPGERVALIFATGPEFFYAFFGILLAGGVPVPLYPPVRLGRLDEYHRRTARMLETAGCKLVLAETRIRRLLGETIERARPALGCCTLDALPEATAHTHAGATDDLALVQFSSGTTVDPKPVALSHRALLAQIRALNDRWRDPGRQPTGVSWLPLYHDMGLIGCVLPVLELPSVMTLLAPETFVARPALWLRTLGRLRADISVAPNFAYGLCVEKVRDEEMTGVDLSAWRLALCGAEPVSPSVLRAFRDRFARWGLRPEALTPVYGLSEAALAVTFGDLSQPFGTRRWAREALAAGRATPAGKTQDAVEIATVGRPLSGFAVRIANAASKPLPAYRVGRVWVRGPSLMAGYLAQPGATAAVFREGWLDTGDLGFLDASGELSLTGRAKDTLIVRGRNHAPAEIEQAASAVAGARRGCAVAVSRARDDQTTEEILVFVEHARDADKARIEHLGEAVEKAVLAATGLIPGAVIVLAPGTLPRTSSGKLRRGETQARHRAGTLTAPATVGALGLGGALVRSARAFRRTRRGRRS